MTKILSNEEKFNKYFSMFVTVGMLVVLGFTSVYKFSQPDANVYMLIMALGASISGVLATVLSANGLIVNFIFGLIDVFFCSVVSYHSQAWGNFGLHVFYILPMQIVGLWMWRKHKQDDGKTVKARKLDGKSALLTLLGVVVALCVSYFVLYRIDARHLAEGSITSLNQTKIVSDSFVFVLNIVGQLLMSLAFFEQWIVWVLVNIASITLWGSILASSPGDDYTVMMVIKYSFYLLNSINGLRIWYKSSRSADSKA